MWTRLCGANLLLVGRESRFLLSDVRMGEGEDGSILRGAVQPDPADVVVEFVDDVTPACAEPLAHGLLVPAMSAGADSSSESRLSVKLSEVKTARIASGSKRDDSTSSNPRLKVLSVVQ